MKKLFVAVFLAAGCSACGSAWADGLTFAGVYGISGNGFGNNARALTLVSHGQGSTMESGCIAPSGAGISAGAGSCAPSLINVGGDEQMPINFPKQSAPTLSSLGISNGSQIGILFDAFQPQNSMSQSIDVNDLTLKLYNGNVLTYAARGSWAGMATNPGNGSSDYLFILDPTAVTAFNLAMGGHAEYRLALDSMISFNRQGAGAESYTLVNRSPDVAVSPTPEPSALLLLGTGIMSTAGVLFHKKKASISASH